MSLIYCKSEDVTRPYYVESLNLHVYSIQELSYVIYQYPLLALDGLVTEDLLDFIEEQLQMSFFASKLKKWLKSKENPDHILGQILAESHYYSETEIATFQQTVLELRKLSQVEFWKKKATLLCSLKQYAKAIKQYQQIIATRKMEDPFVWSNMGVCYARMLLIKQAFEAYQKSYELDKNPDVLEKMIYLSCLDKQIKFPPKDKTQEQEDKINVARQQAMNSNVIIEVDRFDKKEQASKMVANWKQEYREMVAST